MRAPTMWLASSLLLTGISTTACSGVAGAEPSADDRSAVVVTATKDGKPSRLTLSEAAVARLDIQTAVVREASKLARPHRAGSHTSAGELAVPYGAVFYDEQGSAWAFVRLSARTYARQQLVVDHISGRTAFLDSGPQPGTPVVDVGAAELWGAEFGVGE